MSFRVIDEVPVDPGSARVYPEGWQSWSPTTWYPVGREGHWPQGARQHTMRFRPGVALPERGVQGEGLLVLDPGDGQPARRYATVDASEQVASIRARLDMDTVVVSATDEVATSTHAEGPMAALTSYGEQFAARAGVVELRPAPRVWSSWYQYFLDVTAADIAENAAAFDDHDLPFDLVQIDDGWSHGIGESTRLTAGFAALPRLVDQIHAAGRQVGIWLAPFLVGVDSDLARRHPDWCVGPAGYNWGQDLTGLDLTHPGVREHLFATVRGLGDLGVGYLKLDFLYGGAVDGRRRHDVTAVAAYRSGLELIREAAGPETFVLGCGAPILPSVGLVDAMRVSPDTFHEGAEDGSDGLRGRMSLIARAWQQGRFWINDPDCLVARPSYRLREGWADTVREFGGLRSSSDRVAALDQWGLETTRALLRDAPAPAPFSAAVLESSRTIATDHDSGVAPR